MRRPAWISVAAWAVPATSTAASHAAGRAQRQLNLHQLDVEHQRRVRRDHAARAARAVAHVRRNHQPALAADLHADHAFVPALDDLPAPSGNSNGSLRSTELSNFLPLFSGAAASYSQPV